MQRGLLSAWAVAAGGVAVAHFGWIAPVWEYRFILVSLPIVISWIAINHYYEVRREIRAGRARWTAIAAVGAFFALEFVPHLPNRLFTISLVALPVIIALALFVDAWNRPRAHPGAPRRMAGVTVFGLGAIATGLLASVGDNAPFATWQAMFFGSVALLGAGALMMFLDRRRKEKPALWERPAR